MKYLLLFLYFVAQVFAVDSPMEPTPPSLANPESKAESKKEKRKNNFNVLVKLCDGRQVSGKIEIEKEELNIKHQKDGILYEKKANVSEIKQIKISSWSFKKIKKSKDGTIFEMVPEKVFLTLQGGERIQIKALSSTEFMSLVITNANGITKLFSFWTDLQYENGNWFSKLSTSSNSDREDCHPDVIRTINFE
jgi:small nuclear ribonucleoprotein (snRNP)-like protein